MVAHQGRKTNPISITFNGKFIYRDGNFLFFVKAQVLEFHMLVIDLDLCYEGYHCLEVHCHKPHDEETSDHPKKRVLQGKIT